MKKTKKNVGELEKLTPKLKSDILIFVNDLRVEGASDKKIRTEIFNHFKLDITLYDLDWKNGAKALIHADEVRKTKEPTAFKHVFDEGEINEFGRSMANLVDERDALEEEKKMVAADYKQKVEAKKTQIKDLSRKINTGFVMKNEMCEVVKDFTKGTKKAYFNGKLVLEDKLTAADFTLPFPNAEN